MKLHWLFIFILMAVGTGYLAAQVLGSRGSEPRLAYTAGSDAALPRTSIAETVSQADAIAAASPATLAAVALAEIDKTPPRRTGVRRGLRRSAGIPLPEKKPSGVARTGVAQTGVMQVGPLTIEPAGADSLELVGSQAGGLRQADLVIQEGRYKVAGTNPDGRPYRGRASIARDGDDYRITWQIAGRTFHGSGQVVGGRLVVDWNAKTPVVYELASDGVLRGSWDEGRATDVLRPVN